MAGRERWVRWIAWGGACALVGAWIAIGLLRGDREMFAEFIRSMDAALMRWLSERLPGWAWRLFSSQPGSVLGHGLVVFLFVAVGRLLALIGAPTVGLFVGFLVTVYFLVREWEQARRESGPLWEHVTDWLGALAGAAAGFWFLF